MTEVNFLTPEATAQLRQIARRVLSEEIGNNTFRPFDTNLTRNSGFVLKASTTGSGITARSTLTVGTGEARIFYKSTGNVLTAYSTVVSETISVCNLNELPIAAGEFFHGLQDNFGAIWALAPGNGTVIARGLMAQQMCDTHSARNVDNMKVFGSIAAPTQVENPAKLEAQNNDVVYAVYNTVDDQWEAIQVEHKNRQVMVDLNIDGVCFDAEMLTANIQYCSSATATVELFCGATCT